MTKDYWVSGINPSLLRRYLYPKRPVFVIRWKGGEVLFFRMLLYKTRLWTTISSDIAEIL